MILIRRILLIPVSLVFFVFLLLTLILLQLSDTFLKPDFYTSELDENGVYEFVLVNLLTVALEDRRAMEEAESEDDIDDTPLQTSGLTTDQIVASVNRAVPPEWVQELVEQAFEEFGNYITGRTDDFTFTLKAGDRVDTVVKEIKSLLTRADAYDLLYDRELIPRIEDASQKELPLGIEVTGDRLVSAARSIIPPEWVQEQVENILDEVTPYLKGDSDTFTIRIPLSGRVGIAIAEIKQLLRETDVYDLVYDEVIAPQVTEQLGDTIGGLPFGVTVSSDEVVSALREVAPPAWVQQQAERLLDEASPYLTGQVDSFETEVSLVDNKRQARRVLTELAERKIHGQIDALPTCRTIDQARAALSGGSGSLPSCIPPNIDANEVLGRLGINVGAEVARFVLAPIPSSITFSDLQLRNALEAAGAGANLEQLDDIRSLLGNGWTYTQDDLREDLTENGDESDFETLQDLRSFLADGWTYTRADFAEDITDERGAGTMEDIDLVRDILKTFRTYQWLIYVSMVIFLVVMGFLGGRGWSGRIKWGSSSLLVSAAIIFILFGPVYAVGSSIGLDNARDQALEEINSADDYSETARLAANKGFDIAESISDGFASNIAVSSLTLVIIAAILLTVAILWSQIVGLVRRPG